ncbi:MAG: metal-dependent hydrolase, partial [Erythrobacter sp.]
THPALDWLNVYGIRLLEPFSSRWFYGDTLFIIDVWLWVLLGFATWFSLRREKRGGEWQQPARAAMAVALAYIGLNGAITAHHQRNFVRSFEGMLPDRVEVIASPPPIEFWTREVLIGELGYWGRFIDNPGNHDAIVDLNAFCVFDNADLSTRRREDSQVDAFLFWSRAPFAERAPDGSVILRDARFYDPRARGRFSVALPYVECEPEANSSP